MALPSPTYVSAPTLKPFTSAVACGVPIFSCPFPGVNIAYVLKQEFMQFNDNWTPLAINTPYPDANYAAFLLTEESERQDAGCGTVRWTRTYAKVPATYSQPTSITYNFIGFWPLSLAQNVGGGTVVPGHGRQRFTRNVTGRAQYDYFLLHNPTLVDNSTYNSITDIPLIDEQRYYNNTTNAVAAHVYTNEIAYSTELIPNTTPTRDAYEALIAGKTEIVAQASQVRRWLGNIVERETIYILPE